MFANGLNMDLPLSALGWKDSLLWLFGKEKILGTVVSKEDRTCFIDCIHSSGTWLLISLKKERV